MKSPYHTHMTMNRNTKTLLIAAGILTGLCAAADVVIGNSPSDPTTDNVSVADILRANAEADSIAEAQMRDSILRAESAARLDRATALYKDVKFMLYEGELESKLYPAVYEANAKAMAALDSAYDDSERQRAFSILTDLNPVLMHGALYWSGQNDSQKQADFARAYIDTQLLPEAKDVNFSRDERLFPSLAYAAAYGATNASDTEDAKKYFRLYLESGEEARRQNVVKYYGQACLATGDYADGLSVLEEGAIRYPTDMQILTLALQTCLDGGLTDRMQPLLDKALILNPHEEKLQNLQAQLCEHNQDFRQALDIYQRLAEVHPESLEIHQHLASCYYNLGASHYNASIMDEDEKAASRHRRQSRSYFASAATALGHVLANTPSDMKYLRALAHTYAALGEKDRFEETNTRIRAFGGNPIAFNSMPVLIGTQNANGGVQAVVKVPDYEDFARPYIEKELGKWALRGEFEKLDDYSKRLAGEGSKEAYEKINKQAEEAYLKNYARQLVITDLKRSDYDIDNEIYRIETPYGETIIKVPSKNREAEAFKAGWETAQIRAPRFIIRDNKVALSRITYIVNGKKYTYNSDDDATYVTPAVYVDINGILADVMNPEGARKGQQGAVAGVWKESDIDRDIPVTSRKTDNLFALLIANEQYDKASDVFGALHDGDTFRQYCLRTLGMPENNVILINNATGNQVRDAIATLSRKVKGAGPDSEFIVYYAGHGMPDDASKEAYMMPVDANPLVMSTLIPMKEIYAQLGSIPAASASVFVDACFSGTDRDGKMFNEARGVVLKTRPAAPQGNMFVLSAASAQETALPYREKHHGLFTYFLLKKLQESKGNATLRQISDYVINNVRTTSDAVNGKQQNPTVSTSGNMTTRWESKKLKK